MTASSVLMMPDDKAPKSDAEWVSRSAEIVGRYPADWRGHLARASAVGDDPVAREQETNIAIADMMRMGVSRSRAEENAYGTTGLERERVGDWARAQKLYSRALMANPAAEPPRLRRSYVEQAQGEFDAARNDATVLVQAHPDEVAFATRLAEALFAAGKLDEAMTFGDKAISLKPGGREDRASAGLDGVPRLVVGADPRSSADRRDEAQAGRTARPARRLCSPVARHRERTHHVGTIC